MILGLEDFEAVYLPGLSFLKFKGVGGGGGYPLVEAVCPSGIWYSMTHKLQRRILGYCNIQDGGSWKLLTIITKRSIVDVAAALDPPLKYNINS